MPPHPIHVAAERGDLAEVQRLIIEDPALLELRDALWRRPPLLIAADESHAEMLEWLLHQGADREAQAHGECDALWLASQHGHTAIVSVLLGRGFDVNRRDILGWTPLMAAACEGHVAAVEVLLSRKEIGIDRQNADGKTALYWASNEDELEVLSLLVQAGADPRIADNVGETPLDVAIDRGHDECIPLLEVSK